METLEQWELCANRSSMGPPEFQDKSVLLKVSAAVNEKLSFLSGIFPKKFESSTERQAQR